MVNLWLPIRTWRGRLGLGVLALGLALAGTSGGYYWYSRDAVARLDQLVTLTDSPVQELPSEWRNAQTGDLASRGLGRTAEGAALPTLFGSRQAIGPGAVRLAAVPKAPANSSDPRFRWADWNTLPPALGKAPKATRIVIPAIGVDSPVVEVDIVWEGDHQVWQRPKKSVGHHIGTANPGELGNVVLSGHINSPVRGEGSVFKRLPEIPERMRAGEPIEVFVYTEEKTHVYRIVQNDVVEPEEVRVFDPADKPTLTIITCVPDLVFSHRLAVTGLLVKLAEGGSPSAGQKVEGPVVSPRQ